MPNQPTPDQHRAPAAPLPPPAAEAAGFPTVDAAIAAMLRDAARSYRPA